MSFFHKKSRSGKVFPAAADKGSDGRAASAGPSAEAADEKAPGKIVDFQADALEIKNQRLPWGIRLCVWFPFLALAGAVAWACWAEVDVVVFCGGKLVTDLPTVVLKPLERSVIQEVHVKIGDVVKKDQILITFDPTFNAAEAERLNNEIAALEAQLKRLESEFKNQPYPGGDDQFSQWQTAIYQQRSEYYREKMHYYEEALLQIAASTKNKEDNWQKQKERLSAVQQLEDMFKSLHEKNATSLKDLIQMSITRMEMEATVDQLANDLLELEHRRGALLAEQQSFVQEWRNRISEEMVSVDRTLVSMRKEYDKVAQLIKYVHLRSPCNAVVHEIATFSPGSAVREAEALIILTPLDGNIELECEIRPEDIGRIEINADARIKLTAYPFQKYGTLSGVVRNISEDTLEKSAGAGTLRYYRARVTVGGELHGAHKTFRLIPGMEAQCEIKCGRRRVIEYVLYPLLKALDETAREP